MSRSADWQLRLDGEAWTLHTTEGVQRQEVAGAPEAMLARIEARPGAGKMSLSVILGDAWLRYLVIAWPPGMRRSDERRAFMAHRFNRVHEIAEPEWCLAMDSSVADYPALACAAPASLLNAVRDFAEARNLRLAGVSGDFPASFNDCIDRLDEPAGTLGALALLRGSRLTVGFWRDGAWLGVRSQNVLAQGEGQLQALLDSWGVEFSVAGAPGEAGVLYAAGQLATVGPAWRQVMVDLP